SLGTKLTAPVRLLRPDRGASPAGHLLEVGQGVLVGLQRVGAQLHLAVASLTSSLPTLSVFSSVKYRLQSSPRLMRCSTLFPLGPWYLVNVTCDKSPAGAFRISLLNSTMKSGPPCGPLSWLT